MTAHEQQPLKMPPQRRLIATDVPGVYRRGKRYVAVTQSRGRKVKSSHETKDQARRAKLERQARARPSSREPFDSYAERWLVEYRGRTAAGLSPQTRQDYAQVMRTWVIPYFGRTRLDGIGPLDVKRFIDHLGTSRPLRSTPAADRLAGSSIRRIMTPLKAMLAEARELELIGTDPARVRIVVPQREAEGSPKVLDAQQILDVLARIPERHRLLFELLRWTGLRISEALGLQWRDVAELGGGPIVRVRRQCRNGQVLDKPKTAASVRGVALVPSLAAALVERRSRLVQAPLKSRFSPVVPGPISTVTTCVVSCGRRWRPQGFLGLRRTRSVTRLPRRCCSRGTTPALSRGCSGTAVKPSLDGCTCTCRRRRGSTTSSLDSVVPTAALRCLRTLRGHAAARTARTPDHVLVTTP